GPEGEDALVHPALVRAQPAAEKMRPLLRTGRFARHPGASAGAESAPQFVGALAVHRDGRMGQARSLVRSLRAGLVGAGAGVENDGSAVPEQLEGERVGVAVARLLVGAERAVLEEQLVAGLADDRPAGVGKPRVWDLVRAGI